MEVDQAGGEVPSMGDVGNSNPLSPTGAASNEAVGGTGGGDNVIAGTGTAGSVTVSLHPLVIMNISEHWTRTRAQNDGKPQQGELPFILSLSDFVVIFCHVKCQSQM